MKLMKGRVVSNKMTKTAVVLVEGTKTNRMYRKSYVYSNKYLVDDSIGAKIGDVVEFEKCAPISKRKHWRIVKVLGRDMVAVETEIMKEVALDAIEEVMPEEISELSLENKELSEKSKKGEGESRQVEIENTEEVEAEDNVEVEQQTANRKPLTASKEPKKAVSRKPKAVSPDVVGTSKETK